MLNSLTHIRQVYYNKCEGTYGLVEKSPHFEPLRLKIQLRVQSDNFRFKSPSLDYNFHSRAMRREWYPHSSLKRALLFLLCFNIIIQISDLP